MNYCQSYRAASHSSDPIVTIAGRISTLEFLKGFASAWSSCCRTRKLSIVVLQNLNSSLCVLYWCLICTSRTDDSTWPSVSDLQVCRWVCIENSNASTEASYCCSTWLGRNQVMFDSLFFIILLTDCRNILTLGVKCYLSYGTVRIMQFLLSQFSAFQ